MSKNFSLDYEDIKKWVTAHFVYLVPMLIVFLEQYQQTGVFDMKLLTAACTSSVLDLLRRFAVNSLQEKTP